MSIHQAKGLEFPIVVIPDLNRKPNPRDALLGLHPELGLVVRPPRTPPAADRGRRRAGLRRQPGLAGLRGHRGRRGPQGSAAALLRRGHEGPRSPGPLGGARGRARGGRSGRGLSHGRGLLLHARTRAIPGRHPPRCSSSSSDSTGEPASCLARLPDGWPAPSVSVIVATPPEPEGRRRRASATAVPGDRAGDHKRRSPSSPSPSSAPHTGPA